MLSSNPSRLKMSKPQAMQGTWLTSKCSSKPNVWSHKRRRYLQSCCFCWPKEKQNMISDDWYLLALVFLSQRLQAAPWFCGRNTTCLFLQLFPPPSPRPMKTDRSQGKGHDTPVRGKEFRFNTSNTEKETSWFLSQKGWNRVRVRVSQSNNLCADLS